jgi:hypothetical protein
VSLYDVLGVEPDASAAAIRRAYVALARRYHPDFHTGAPDGVRAANQRAMQAVNEAWTVLSDPAARQAYDDRRQSDAREPASGSRRSVHEDWRPFDDGDDEDVDPRLLDDGPDSVPAPPALRLVTVLPTLAFLGGVLLAVVGLVVNLLPLSLLGLLAIGASAVAFFVLPLFALSASARNDRR